MNKKILLLLVSVLVLAIFAVPVMAKPTNGPNKAAVVVTMIRNTASDGGGNGIVLIAPVFTGPIIHVVLEQHFTTTITFEDGSTLDGTIVVERKVVNIKAGARVILTDHYVFDFGDGGFEGNGVVVLDNVNQMSKAYGMYHGTGDFEGQTLNIGHGWESYIGVINPWFGYWLKCSVYP